MPPLGMLLLVITVITVLLAVLAVAYWFTRRRAGSRTEPVIELERLVSCKACGSMIPEGVRKCAFCGASQRQPMNP